MKFNQRVKTLRNALGMSQKRFGEPAFLSQGFISEVERGDKMLGDAAMELLCIRHGANVSWLRDGVGEMFSKTDPITANKGEEFDFEIDVSPASAASGVAYEKEPEAAQPAAAEPERSYDPHGGWSPRSFEDVTGIDAGYRKAFTQLKEIFDSGSDIYKRAIEANLQAFSGAIKTEQRIRQLEESHAKQRGEMEELRGLVGQLAKQHAYNGENRRSGEDRRHVVGEGPGGIERRSGEERRKAKDNGSSLIEE